MKFTVSTKPLQDGLNLGIVNANVSKFYRKSCLAQVTATKSTLTVNLEAASILSEIKLRGSGDEDTQAMIFVDSLLLKQLVSTFDTGTITLEFVEGGLILHSGKSKFTLPKIIDVDMQLNTPTSDFNGSNLIPIDKTDWKFVKDFQMYAIAMSFVHPVYTMVWVGESGDVIVGDFDNSLFTYSKKSKLGSTCLLSDTIINLFNSLPEGAQLAKAGKSYVITVTTDSFSYTSEFTPKYEEDEGVGSYNSSIILSMMKPSEACHKLSAAAVNKILGQVALISSGAEDAIKFSISDNVLSLVDKNVDGKIAATGSDVPAYELDFKTALLKSVFSNYADEEVNVCPMSRDDEIVGIIVWNDKLTTVLAGVD